MQPSEPVLRKRRLTLAALALLPTMAGCSNEKVFRWEEEVTLSGGEALLLERTTRFRKKGAPFNPLETIWGEEDSSILVRAGPADLVGARFGLREWFIPVVIDRDPESRRLVLIATAFNCDWVQPYKGKNRSIYVAFELRPGAEAAAVDFPAWAWNRKRNLYLMSFDVPVPQRVTAERAREHNATDARGTKRFFVVDPTVVAPDCPGESK